MRNAPHRALSTLAIAAFALGALTACADGEPAEFDTPAQADTPTAADEDAPEEGSAPEEDSAPEAAGDDGAAPVAVEHPAPGDAVATHTYSLDRPAGASVTVAVHPLRVDGSVMLLQLSFTPDFRGDEPLTVFQMNQWRSFDPAFTDRENLKQYTVIQDHMGTILATDVNGPRVASGETLTYWAYFPAPEDDIDSIVVTLDNVEFENVPIERP